MLMEHFNAFAQYLHESGARGGDSVSSTNWFMLMADRRAGVGHFGVRTMLSAEPLTVRGCGYPDLLQSGELCGGETIHDQQHPHNLFMELAATYDAPLPHASNGLRFQIYGGLAGEPALGPVSFPHRLSAMDNPLAPIAHHWLDATHVTFGVITGGVYTKTWKAETSVFNGREPDENRTNIELGSLNSWSGRFSYMPAPSWALQVSAGRLAEAEARADGGPRVDLTRFTASATYHYLEGENVWASTIGWGRNAEAGGLATNAFFAETNFTVAERNTWYGRLELVGKTGEELAIPSSDPNAVDANTVGKINGGYTHFFSTWKGLKAGVGAGLSAGFVPQELQAYYTQRVNLGIAMYATLRPARMAR
jgi:hypothetical protein